MQRRLGGSSAVRLLERFLQILAVQSKTFIFPGESSSGTDRSSGFTGQLGGFFVSLILEHNNLLHEAVNSLQACDIT